MAKAEDLIIASLKEKATLKLDLYQQMLAKFEVFKSTTKSICQNLNGKIHKSDKRISVEYSEKLFEINSLFDIDVQVSNKPNRLFMFPSECWHGVPSFYGDEPRYTQVFFIKNIKITKKKSDEKISYYGKNHICFAEPNFQVAQGG
jgi:hypothetical protein